MSIVDTRPDTEQLYRAIATFMALLVMGTAVRIVCQVFSGPAIEPIGLGIAVLSMILLSLAVVSAGPSRRRLGRRFKQTIAFLFACNTVSHLVWLATLAIGGYL